MKSTPFLSCLVIATILICLPAYGDTVTLVHDGQPQATIMTGGQRSQRVGEAAELLARIIEKSSGATLPITADDLPPDGNVIRLIIDDRFGEVDLDGFEISSPSATEIHITGGSEYGVYNGAMELLERYAGVRWLLPGDIGEHVPAHQTIDIPRDTVAENPAFISRQISGYAFKGSYKENPLGMFLVRHRLRGRINFHHYLLHLFPVSVFGETHPQIYPTLDGKRYIPPDDEDWAWQPALHAPGAVDAAIDRINAFFDDNPDATTYSLGMNDAHAWDDSVTHEDIPRNTVGLYDLSDYFFTWANLVAEGVSRKHPGKWFGCLAYNETTDPPSPSIGVHQQVVPYVCIDRMYWADPDMRRKDIERTQEWMATAEVFGWYDYIYGDEFYKLPRVYPHLMSEYIQFGYNHGVRAYYAEAYPTEKWIEGPKLYVFMNLLWDPYQDVDALLDEWYDLSVGPDAAPHLKAYYEFWEQFWTERVPETGWFKDSAAHTVYLHFSKDGYFKALQVDDIDTLAGHMDQMLASAKTDEQKARAQFLYDGWLSVRKSMEAYVAMLKLRAAAAEGRVNTELIFANDLEPQSTNTVETLEGSKDWTSVGLPQSWGFWQRTSSFGKYGWDQSTGRDSTASLRIDPQGCDGQPMLFMRSISVEPDSLYHLRCFVRCEGIADDALITITVKWKNPDGSWATQFVGAEQRLADVTVDGWQPIDLYLRTPPFEKPGLVYMLSVENAKAGTVWFDDPEMNRIVSVDE